jgi:two-component system nitrogen regulation response regulator GlnG
MVREGSLRRDLYYRLKVFAILLPPLRERLEDLPLLLEFFIRMYGRELGKNIRSVAPESMRILREHSWPGNVRELQSCVKSALVHAVGETLTPDCLPPSCLARAAGDGSDSATEEALLPDVRRLAASILDRGEADVYRLVHSEVDRVLLERVLNHFNGNQAQAATVLGISRTTLRTRIAELGLVPRKRFRAEQAP